MVVRRFKHQQTILFRRAEQARCPNQNVTLHSDENSSPRSHEFETWHHCPSTQIPVTPSRNPPLRVCPRRPNRRNRGPLVRFFMVCLIATAQNNPPSGTARSVPAPRPARAPPAPRGRTPNTADAAPTTPTRVRRRLDRSDGDDGGRR